MIKSILIVAVLALAAPAALAQVQNAGPQGSTGGNNVGAAVSPPAQSAPAPASVPSQAPAVSANNGYGAGSYGAGYGAMAQSTGTINPSNYRTETECLNAAEVAHASMDPCKVLPQK
jgi:hypothetical protein